MCLTLLRHTRTAVGEAVCYGQQDVALADTFPTELEPILAACPAYEVIVSSPLQRCARLAEAIAQMHGGSVVYVDGLIEMDFGAWQGLLWSELPRHELDAWAADFWHSRPHGGESVALFVARVRGVLLSLLERRQHSLVVTHAGVIRAASASSSYAASFSQSVPYGGFHSLQQLVEWG